MKELECLVGLWYLKGQRDCVLGPREEVMAAGAAGDVFISAAGALSSSPASSAPPPIYLHPSCSPLPPSASAPGHWAQAPSIAGPVPPTCPGEKGVTTCWPGMKGSKLSLWSVLRPLPKDSTERGVGGSTGL